MISVKQKISVLAITFLLTSCSSSDNTSAPVGTDAASEGATSDGATSGESNPNPGPVSSDDAAPVDGNIVVALEVVGQDLLLSLAGFQADQLSLSVRELAVEIATAGTMMPQQESTFETLDGFGPEVVVSPTQTTAYTCNAGGQMMHETGRLRSGVGTERSLIADYDAYTFDACSHSEAGGIFAAGDYQLNGELVMNAVDYNASRGGRSSHSNNWAGFSMGVPADIAYELSGSVTASASSAANFGTRDTRTVDLPTYRKTAGVQTIESLDSARLSLTQDFPNGSNESGYQLDADGVTVGSKSKGLTVTINTDPPLSARSVPPGIEELFSGQIRMVSADGGELILSANPTSTPPDNLLVDVVALRPSGESIATDAVPLINILSGGVTSVCFLNDTTSENCGTIELP